MVVPLLTYAKEVAAMQWDLGFQGIGLLLAMSLGFGLVAHLVAHRRTTRWMGLIATASAFVTGLVASEVWFGWATEEDLQPNVNGLSFDEAMLSALLAAVVSVVVMRLVLRSEHHLPHLRHHLHHQPRH